MDVELFFLSPIGMWHRILQFVKYAKSQVQRWVPFRTKKRSFSMDKPYVFQNRVRLLATLLKFKGKKVRIFLSTSFTQAFLVFAIFDPRRILIPFASDLLHFLALNFKKSRLSLPMFKSG